MTDRFLDEAYHVGSDDMGLCCCGHQQMSHYETEYGNIRCNNCRCGKYQAVTIRLALYFFTDDEKESVLKDQRSRR